jgi:hypothetical protein
VQEETGGGGRGRYPVLVPQHVPVHFRRVLKSKIRIHEYFSCVPDAAYHSFIYNHQGNKFPRFTDEETEAYTGKELKFT